MIITLDLPDTLAAQLQQVQQEPEKYVDSLENFLAQFLTQNRPNPSTGEELVNRLHEIGFIGLWKDREDIGDNLEFARRLRAQAQMRETNWLELRGGPQWQ